jgi:hypothetical protein
LQRTAAFCDENPGPIPSFVIFLSHNVADFKKAKDDLMPYVKDDDGRLNNFAKEPPIYAAEPMTAEQKRSRTILFAIGGALVVGLMAVAAVIS